MKIQIRFLLTLICLSVFVAIMPNASFADQTNSKESLASEVECEKCAQCEKERVVNEKKKRVATEKKERRGTVEKRQQQKGNKREKAKHIAAAIKHLEAAGFHEQAERLRQVGKAQGNESEVTERLNKIESRLERKFEELGDALERKLEERLAAFNEEETDVENESEEDGESREDGNESEEGGKAEKKPG
ncbi:MAG: hypothetical protein R3F19_12540 [Verrucomicrobiales bacterium]